MSSRVRASLVMLLFTSVGVADDASYPERTVTVICPWSAGGGTDRVSRFWADALKREFGGSFVVVNRTGGSGVVGHYSSAHAKPDGHTIGVVTFELSTMHLMGITRLTYQDYEPLLQMNADPAAIIVRQDAPWQTLGEWLDDMRENPGTIRMSGTATGGAWDLARAGLQRAAGIPIDAAVWVPHGGAAPSLVELLGGHLEAVCCSVPEVAPQLEGGQLRVLAVMAEERLADFPDLPTAKEQGLDWVVVGWRGLTLPKGAPPELVEILAERCRKIAESAEYQEFMSKNGFGITIRGPEEFTQFLAEQDAQWADVVKAAGYDRGLTGNNDPGPLALPIVLAVCLAAAGGWSLLRGDAAIAEGEVRQDHAVASGRPTVAKVACEILAYTIGVPICGFTLSTLVFVSIVLWKFGARWYSAIGAAVVTVLVVRGLFGEVFAVQLPSGLLGLPF